MQSMFYPSTAEFRELRKIISIVLKHNILTGDFESSNEKYIIRFRNKTVGRDLQLRSLVFFSSSLFFFFPYEWAGLIIRKIMRFLYAWTRIFIYSYASQDSIEHAVPAFGSWTVFVLCTGHLYLAKIWECRSKWTSMRCVWFDVTRETLTSVMQTAMEEFSFYPYSSYRHYFCLQSFLL